MENHKTVSSRRSQTRNAAGAVPLAITLVVAFMAYLPTPAAAEALAPASQRGYKPYPPVEITSYVFEQPRPVRAWTARVDLASPDVELIATCRGKVDAPLETACRTTLEFAAQERVQIAINASPFAPFRQKSGEGMDIVGLGACAGEVYSPPDERFGALVVTRAGEVEIWPAPIDPAKLAEVDDAVGGFRVLVENGKSIADQVAARVPASFAGVNPRTAVGLSPDRQTLWLIIVDGRTPGRSEGFTLVELADFGVSLGCATLLNLDGGGSTTLVVQDPATQAHRVVNNPLGRDTQRLVGNHLGIRMRSAAPATPSARP